MTLINPPGHSQRGDCRELAPLAFMPVVLFPRPQIDSAAVDIQATRCLGFVDVAFTEKAPTFYQSFFNLLRI
jgi:hypothetical protein